MAGYMRIGELSRRTGVKPALLRAWESRYGLLEPSRSAAGYRLYSDRDLARLAAMKANLDAGLSAAEAAARTLAEPENGASRGEAAGDELDQLRVALDRLDDGGAHTVLDRALATLTVDAVLGGMVLPYLAELGDRWERGEVSVAHEHFASHLLRGRLLGLARGWDRGTGPRVVLAAAPGELHDLPLIVFGLALRERGWRITYLGADTPLPTAVEAARTLGADLLVVSATAPERLDPIAAELREAAAAGVPLALAGKGAAETMVESVGARHLTGDPVAEAQRLTQELASPRRARGGG